jgi:hypothetical protein
MPDVLPSSSRSFAVVTLAAARASRLSNHRLYGFDPSSRSYSSTTKPMPYGNAFVTNVASNGIEAIECCDRQEYPAAGMDDYVTKPIRVDALVQALLGAGPRDA